MSYEFYVTMVKRSDGALYPDLNKTDEHIYFTPEDAQAAIDKDPLKGTFIGRHVVKLVAELPKDMDKGYQEAQTRITELEASRESILKQMGGYIAENVALRAKLEKAREAFEGISINLGTGKLRSISENLADEALALLQPSNVVNQIKSEALREAANTLCGIPQDGWGGAIGRLRYMADELLKEKT